MQVDELLKLMVNKGASDLHLTAPSPRVLRIDGALISQQDLPPMTPKGVELALEQVATQEKRSVFDKEWERDCAYTVPELARFRFNELRQRDVISLAFRFVPFYIPSIDEWGLPQIFKEIILKPSGLILATGPSGSGKSTTLPAMLNHLNENTTKNAITIDVCTPEGMQTLDQMLADLVRRKIVALEEALVKSSNPVKLRQSLQSQGEVAVSLRPCRQFCGKLGVR